MAARVDLGSPGADKLHRSRRAECANVIRYAGPLSVNLLKGCQNSSEGAFAQGLGRLH